MLGFHIKQKSANLFKRICQIQQKSAQAKYFWQTDKKSDIFTLRHPMKNDETGGIWFSFEK